MLSILICVRLRETPGPAMPAKHAADEAVWKDTQQTRPASAPIKERREFVPSTVVERAVMHGRDKKRHNSANHISSSARKDTSRPQQPLATPAPHTAQKHPRPTSAQRSRSSTGRHENKTTHSVHRSRDALEDIPPELRPMYGDAIVHALDKRFAEGESRRHRHRESSNR